MSAVTEICRQVSALPWHLPQGAPVDLTQQPGPAPARAGHCVAFASITHHSVCVCSLIRATRCNMIIMPCEIMCHDAPSRDTCETCAANMWTCETLSHTASLSLSLYVLSSLWSLGRPCWHLLLKLQLLLLLHSLTEIWQKRYLALSGIFSLIMIDPCWSLIIPHHSLSISRLLADPEAAYWYLNVFYV